MSKEHCDSDWPSKCSTSCLCFGGELLLLYVKHLQNQPLPQLRENHRILRLHPQPDPLINIYSHRPRNNYFKLTLNDLTNCRTVAQLQSRLLLSNIILPPSCEFSVSGKPGVHWWPSAPCKEGQSHPCTASQNLHWRTPGSLKRARKLSGNDALGRNTS